MKFNSRSVPLKLRTRICVDMVGRPKVRMGRLPSAEHRHGRQGSAKGGRTKPLHVHPLEETRLPMTLVVAVCGRVGTGNTPEPFLLLLADDLPEVNGSPDDGNLSDSLRRRWVILLRPG